MKAKPQGKGYLWNIYSSNKEELQMWFKNELGAQKGNKWQESIIEMIRVS